MSATNPPPQVARRLQRLLANRDLARAQSSYGLLVVAQAAWISTMVVVLFGRAGALGPGIFLVARQLGGAATAPAFALLGERRPMQQVLAVSAAVRAVVVAIAGAVIALSTPPLAMLYVLAVGEGVLASAPYAIHDAMVPRLARTADELVGANAVTSVMELAGYVVGAAIAALVTSVLGLASALAAVVALLVVGAAAAAAVRLADERRDPVAPEALLQRLLGGARYLRRDGDARSVVATLALASAISGFAVATASAIAVVLLHLGAGGAPLLIALASLGGLAGALVMVGLIGTYPLAVLVAGGILLTSSAGFAIAVVSSLAAVVAFFAFGFGTAAQAVGARTLLHRVVPPAELAGAVGVNGLLSVAAVGVGGLAASLLVAAVGVRPLLIGEGVATAAIAVLVFWRLRRVERSANRYQHELQVLQAVAVFAPMSLATKTQVAMALERHDIAAGAEVVREGDVGRTMYVIERGRLGAYIGGQRVRTMVAGDHFGEIALLAGSTRTATVRAEDHATIWSLAADQFLAALRGNTQAHAIAAAVVHERRGSAR